MLSTYAADYPIYVVFISPRYYAGPIYVTAQSFHSPIIIQELRDLTCSGWNEIVLSAVTRIVSIHSGNYEAQNHKNRPNFSRRSGRSSSINNEKRIVVENHHSENVGVSVNFDLALKLGGVVSMKAEAPFGGH